MHGFGTRMSGNGRDRNSITRFLNRNAVTFSRVIQPHQGHTDQVSIVADELKLGAGEHSDGLITAHPGVVLSVISADCMPVLFVDLRSNRVGIAHVGRRGTEKRMCVKMVRLLRDQSRDAVDLRVVLGPAIGACCYPHNLIEENIRQLEGTGVDRSQIDFFPFCTECDTRRFYSYRGAGRMPDFPEQFSYIGLSVLPEVGYN